MIQRFKSHLQHFSYAKVCNFSTVSLVLRRESRRGCGIEDFCEQTLPIESTFTEATITEAANNDPTNKVLIPPLVPQSGEHF